MSNNTRPPTLGESIAALILIVLVLGGVGAGMFWPRTTQGEVTNVNYWGWSSSNSSFTIEFDDGRKLRLTGHPNVSIKKGKRYKVVYNGVSMLYSVEEIE